MHAVEVLGTRVTYAVDGQGPALVLVAGTGGNLDSNWAHLVEPLASRRTVIRPDYSGSGETTDPPGDLSLDLWLDLIRHDPHDFARLILLTGFSPAFLGRMDAAQLTQWTDAVLVSNRWEGIARQIRLDAGLDIPRA